MANIATESDLLDGERLLKADKGHQFILEANGSCYTADKDLWDMIFKYQQKLFREGEIDLDPKSRFFSRQNLLRNR